MTVRIFRSSDASAPSIGRSLGSIITLLDACLVDGYGAKTPLGWTKPYSGVNKAVYKMGGGTNMFLRVQDDSHADYVPANGTNLALAFECTGVDTLVDKFAPLTMYLTKPDTVANGGGWVLVGDEHRFFLFTTRGGWGPAHSSSFIGDISSLSADPASDRGKAMIIGAVAAHTLQNLPGASTEFLPYHTSSTLGTVSGHWIAGDSQGISGSGAGINVAKMVAFNVLDTLTRFPSGVGRGLLSSPIYIAAAAGVFGAGAELRGSLPGLHYPYAISNQANSAYTAPNGKEYTYTQGAMAGKTLEAINVWGIGGAGAYFPLLIETSNTWEA